MDIKQFISHIIQFNNVSDILNTYETQSEKGFIFERIFDIVIKLANKLIYYFIIVFLPFFIIK